MHNYKMLSTCSINELNDSGAEDHTKARQMDEQTDKFADRQTISDFINGFNQHRPPK